MTEKSVETILNDMSSQIRSEFKDYKPHHHLDIKGASFALKTASSMDELLAVFKLRYQNFLEHVTGDEHSYDWDEFDHICDHLIIEEISTKRIVGTYRILSSLYVDKFYSSSEFNLSEFLKVDGVKNELGRACIDQAFRNGHVIDLLWRGIAEYGNLTNGQYLFGCSSVDTTNINIAFNLYEFMKEKGYCEDKFDVTPVAKYQMDFSTCQRDESIDLKKLIPPLLRSYITAGSRVIGQPALDKDFECIDFLTIMNLDDLTSMYKKRYFKK